MTWEPTAVTITDWGKIRLVVGGRDVTWFRNVETKVQGWQHTDPYGPNQASIAFPQIRVHDDRDSDPDLAWLHEGAVVKVEHVVAGAVVNPSDPPFYGWVDSVEESDDGTLVSCSGNLNGRLSMALHQPSIVRRDAKDAGYLLAREIGFHSRWHKLHPTNGLVTGIPIQMRGSRDMTRLGFLDAVLELAITEGGDSTTILPDPTLGLNHYRHQWRTIKSTPDATVDAGAPGVQISMRRDLVDMPTAIYGEGVSPKGERWRNAKYPNLGPDVTIPPYPFGDGRSFGLGTTDADTATGDGIITMVRELWGDGLLAISDNFSHVFDSDIEAAVKQTQRDLGLPMTGVMTPALWAQLYNNTGDHMSFSQAHFEPLAYDPRTRYFNRAPDGTAVGVNPTWDGRIPKVDGWRSYGESVTKHDARRNANGEMSRSAARTGTVTLTTDPAEMSRFDIRAGMTLKLRHYLGGKKVYISSVQVDWSSQSRPVTLAVSTTARHYLDLLTLRQRRLEARQDPAKQWRHQLRRSAQTSDAIMGWEGESGAGIIRTHDLIGGQWNVIPFVACEVGTMGQLRLETSGATPFICAAFADRVFPGVLGYRLGNPFKWVVDTNVEASGRTVDDAVITNGSDVLTSGSANFRPHDVGRDINGAGIDASATIQTVVSDTKIHMSSQANADATGVTITLPAQTTTTRETTWQANAKWLIDDERLLVEAWGTPEQPCGYWPHHHTNDQGVTTHPPTGVFRDDGSWDFATESNFLYLAVWPQANCTIHGRARISINDAP